MNKILFLGGFVFVFMSGLFGYGISYIGCEQYRYEGLVNFGVKTDGIIAAKYKDRRRLVYSYDVDGVRYSGHQGGGREEFESFSIGDTVMVTYDASDPNESWLGDAKYQLAGNELLIWRFTTVFSVVGLVFYTGMIVILKLIKKR